MATGRAKREAYDAYASKPAEFYFRRAQERVGVGSVIEVFTSAIIIVIFSQYIIYIDSISPTLERLFLNNSLSFQSAVPYMILFCFVWCTLMMIVRFLATSIENRPLHNQKLLSFVDRAKDVSLPTAMEGVAQSAGSEKSLMFNRLAEIISAARAANGQDLQSEYFSQRWALQNQNRLARYEIPRILIWGMPMLGFIGTVFGVGTSIGDFSGFLAQSGDSIEIGAIKERLAGVASGLAYAFDTTLLGLSGAVLSMLCVTFVQSREERVISDIDATSLGFLEAILRQQNQDQVAVQMDRPEFPSHNLVS